MTKKQVVIVGGGLAGLSTAESLLRHHADKFQVTILEAKRTTGGRAGSFHETVSGESVDYCQHVAMGCCTNLLGLLDRCQLSDSLQRYRELEFLHPNFEPSRFAPIRWLPPPLHLAMTIGSLKYLTWSQQRTIRRGLMLLMRTKTATLESTTAADWLRRAGQDSGSIRDFWNVILVSALGESTEYVSMAAARKVMMDGFAAAHGASDVLVPREPLAVLFGEKLTSVMKALGAEVHVGECVERIDSSPVCIKTRCGKSYTADHVVSAAPWHRVGDFLEDPDIRRAIPNLDAVSRFPASPITGIHLWFDRAITEQTHHVMVGTTAQWLFRDPFESNGSDDETTRNEFYHQVVISASHESRSVPKEELVNHILTELRRAFPSTANARLIRSQIVSDPRSVFSARPDVESMRPPARTALPWFHLAGDWTDTGWPSTMEGAVISGIQAASSVLETENLKPIAADTGLQRGWLARRLIKT